MCLRKERIDRTNKNREDAKQPPLTTPRLRAQHATGTIIRGISSGTIVGLRSFRRAAVFRQAIDDRHPHSCHISLRYGISFARSRPSTIYRLRNGVPIAHSACEDSSHLYLTARCKTTQCDVCAPSPVKALELKSVLKVAIALRRDLQYLSLYFVLSHMAQSPAYLSLRYSGIRTALLRPFYKATTDCADNPYIHLGSTTTPALQEPMMSYFSHVKRSHVVFTRSHSSRFQAALTWT
ncbi:hypothetical protein C8Q70DRAFT_26240 [Cubamyces menziesii]|nr:hypothetical protein C8Q70DRAFT_26240 [Cubamyces menziesii]